jgi:hypothetical protein
MVSPPIFPAHFQPGMLSVTDENMLRANIHDRKCIATTQNQHLNIYWFFLCHSEYFLGHSTLILCANALMAATKYAEDVKHLENWWAPTMLGSLTQSPNLMVMASQEVECGEVE